MTRIEPFDSQSLQAICKVLGDTERGLTGTQIGALLQDIKAIDVTPTLTKWKRLFNALADLQNEHGLGNHTIMLVNRAMNPVSYARNRDAFQWRRDELNVVLAFSGFYLGEDGKVAHATKAISLDAARERTGRLRSALENRRVHAEVLFYCRIELLDENYFHAVFEAIKGLADRIRKMSGLTVDGAELIQRAFSLNDPILSLNRLTTESEKSEQKGFISLVVGVFGAIRNPIAHESKLNWPMSEQDALDILSMVSLVHRKLDNATKIKT
jgi:uncharacterized protein (TIGR02391 family)